MNMDQSVAQHLFDVGAMIILLDVPPGTEIGIDTKSWHSAENFKGIKMIPPGIHYIYFKYVMMYLHVYDLKLHFSIYYSKFLQRVVTFSSMVKYSQKTFGISVHTIPNGYST